MYIDPAGQATCNESNVSHVLLYTPVEARPSKSWKQTTASYRFHTRSLFASPPASSGISVGVRVYFDDSNSKGCSLNEVLEVVDRCNFLAQVQQCLKGDIKKIHAVRASEASGVMRWSKACIVFVSRCSDWHPRSLLELAISWSSNCCSGKIFFNTWCNMCMNMHELTFKNNSNHQLWHFLIFLSCHLGLVT